MQKGICLPNWEYQPYTAAEVAALSDLAPSTLVWLLYGPLIDAQHVAQVAPFLAAHPTRVLFRPYNQNIGALDPTTWATTCHQWMVATGVSGEMIPANEFNVEWPGSTWAQQTAWLTAFAAAWRSLTSVPLHLPALSPSGDYQTGLQNYATIQDLFDYGDVHAYGTAFNSSLYTATQYLTLPLDITEFNQIDPSAALTDAQDFERFDSCSFFLLGGTLDQAAYNILDLPSYYTSFKEWDPMSEPTSTITVGEGVQNALNKYQDTAKGSELYFIGDLWSITPGEKNGYLYSSESGEVYIFPKA